MLIVIKILGAIEIITRLIRLIRMLKNQHYTTGSYTLRQDLAITWCLMRPILIISAFALIPFVFIVPQCIDEDSSLFGYENPRLDIIGRNDVFEDGLPVIQRMADKSSMEYAEKLCLAHIYDRIIFFDIVFLLLIIFIGWIGIPARSRKMKELNPDSYEWRRTEPMCSLGEIIIIIPLSLLFSYVLVIAGVGIGFPIREAGLPWLIDIVGPEWAFRNSMWFLVTLGQLPKIISIFFWAGAMGIIHEIAVRPRRR